MLMTTRTSPLPEGVGAGGEVDAAAVLQGDGVSHGGAQVCHHAGGAGEGAEPEDGDGLGGGHGCDGRLGVVGGVGVQGQAQILDVVVERVVQGAAVFTVLGQGVFGGDHDEVPGAQFALEVGPAAVAQVLGGADNGGVVDVGALGNLGDVGVRGQLRIAADHIDHPAPGPWTAEHPEARHRARHGRWPGAVALPRWWQDRRRWSSSADPFCKLDHSARAIATNILCNFLCGYRSASRAGTFRQFR